VTGEDAAEEAEVAEDAEDVEAEQAAAIKLDEMTQNITSFDSAEKSIFDDAKVREQTEHNYGFSGQSIEEFSAVLENKLESLTSFED
jgi:hypothetical protein